MYRLELTSSTASQKVLMVFAMLLAGVVGGCLGIAVVMLAPTVFKVLVGVTLLPMLLLLGYATLRVLRARTWLEGPVLAVRGVFTTRRCNLATAPVRIGSRQLHTTVSTGDATFQVPAGRMPVLEAQHPETGKWLTVNLRDGHGNLLDPAKLHALAATMTSEPRSEPGRSHAAWAARGLVELADNPVYRLL